MTRLPRITQIYTVTNKITNITHKYYYFYGNIRYSENNPLCSGNNTKYLLVLLFKVLLW